MNEPEAQPSRLTALLLSFSQETFDDRKSTIAADFGMSIAEIEDLYRLALDTRLRSFFHKTDLISPRLGLEIQSRGHLRLGSDGRLWEYQDGCYRPTGDHFARTQTKRILGDRCRRRHYEEVVAWLRATYPSLQERPDTRTLNLKNGMLDFRTGNLEPHSPENASCVQIPVAWNPEATCPRIDNFLEEVMPEGSTEFIHEIIGYALYAGNPMRKAIMLYGPGANGKSVFLNVVRALVGDINCSALSLQMLAENRFASALLYGKLANIYGDLDARSVKQTDIFKTLTGGDDIYAEQKYLGGFSFKPFALPLFSANDPPLVSDQSDAWFDRWLIIPMNRPIESVNPRLIETLTEPAELEGLLVQAVSSLARLIGRGRFKIPASVGCAHGDYRLRLDSVLAFVTEECGLFADAWTPRPQLYRLYRAWAKDGGRMPVSSATFNDHIRRGAYEASESKRRGVVGWQGIGILEKSRDFHLEKSENVDF